MKFIRAKSISYGSVRPYENVKAIVIHYTGISNDTAENECNYFAHGNTRAAGAHFFVDRKGTAIKSIPMSRAAWSVGIFFTKAGGAAKYWGTLNNYNTISIEMCDCAKHDPSKAQIKAIKKVIKYIRKKCPNATKVVRHFDICGKQCPGRMSGGPGTQGYERWQKLLRDLGETKAKTIEKVKKKAEKAAKKDTTAKKTNLDIAQEVIAGKWGNGKIRQQRLTAAGYDYATIQKLVNTILK